MYLAYRQCMGSRRGFSLLLIGIGAFLLFLGLVCLVRLFSPVNGVSAAAWTLTGIGVGVMGLLCVSVGTMVKRGDI
jgi:hypothetical protein